MSEPVRRIATEEAFVTPDIAAATRRIMLEPECPPALRGLANSVFGDSEGARRLQNQLLDIGEGRIAQMDETGIDVHLLSVTSPGLQALPAEVAAPLAEQANDILAQALRNHPDRFWGLTAIAAHHPQRAVKEIQRGAHSLGMRGILINSHSEGKYLDAPEFLPVLEAAEAERQPIYLHPREPSPQMAGPYVDYGLYTAIWGFAAETALHALRLIFSGTFDRFPKLKIVLGHMGEGLPFWLQRIDNRYSLFSSLGALKPLKRLPSEYFLENFVVTTSGVVSPAALELTLKAVGEDNVLFAADHPYEDAAEAVAFIDTVNLSGETKAKILHRNAERVFQPAVRG